MSWGKWLKEKEREKNQPGRRKCLTSKRRDLRKNKETGEQGEKKREKTWRGLGWVQRWSLVASVASCSYSCFSRPPLVLFVLFFFLIKTEALFVHCLKTKWAFLTSRRVREGNSAPLFFFRLPMCLSPDVRLRRCLSPRRAALSIYPSFFQVCFFLRKQPLCPSLSVSVCTASLRCVEASGSSRVRRYAISIFVSLGYVCVCRCIVFHLSVCLLVHLVSLPFLSFFFFFFNLSFSGEMRGVVLPAPSHR